MRGNVIQWVLSPGQALVLALALMMSGCGTKESSAPKPQGEAGPQQEKSEQEKNKEKEKGKETEKTDPSRMADGKYFLSAVNVEAYNEAGAKLDTTQLTVSGDYYWFLKFIGESKYEVTATGAAKISNTNRVLLEINCRGAQDKFVFSVTESGALRDLTQTETGCPQGATGTASVQRQFLRVGPQIFKFLVTTANNGAREIDEFVFTKS